MKIGTESGIQNLFTGRTSLALAGVVFLAGCAALQGDSGSRQAAAPGQTTETAPLVDAAAALSTSAVDLAQAKGGNSGDAALAAPVIYRGTDQQVNLPAAQKPIRFVGDAVSLNFEQAPLGEVVNAVMGDILDLDYVIDQPVQGKVTLRTRTPIPRDELLGVLESLMRANNTLMIRGEDGRYLISNVKRGRTLAPSLSNSGSSNAGYSTVIVPLQYVSARAMADILAPVADESAFVRVDNARGLLMLAGTRDQLDGWLDIVHTFDINMLEGMSVGMFPLQNSEVEEVSAIINELLSGGEGGKLGIDGMVRVIPFERLNSILVVTPRSHYLDIVAKWIKRVDVTPHSSYEKQLFVYPVQNTTAERLADLLTSIYSGGSASRSSSGGSSRGQSSGFSNPDVAPGLSPETLSSGKSGGGFGSTGTSSFGGGGKSGKSRSRDGIGASGSTTSRAGGAFAASGAAGVTANMLGQALGSEQSPIDDVRVVADEDNNALMIYATGKQYQLIESALEKLDINAPQVIIEASILEVSLTDELRYGLEWTFKHGLPDDHDAVGLLANSAGGPAAVLPGFSYTVTDSIGDITAVINALAKDSLINVISTPSVMVLDNHEASIHVGDSVPVFSAQTTTDGGVVTQSVEYRDTGVQLSVRPSVNAGGLVTMDVEQSVTDIGTIDTATGQRSFLERTISSRVAVRSNESVVLGGLIRENATDTDSGLPILHKLPLIGPLFGSTSKEDRRTELLVIITPRALYNETELRQVSKEMRAQIRHMELIEEPAE